MKIQFFDDPSNLHKTPENTRINQIGIHVFPDNRRVAVGFDITPFRERPSLEVVIVNEHDEVAGTLNVIETLSPNFHLTMHLQDKKPTQQYNVFVELYYAQMDKPRQVVDRHTTQFTIPQS